MNINGYWISCDIGGKIRHLYKVEKDVKVFRYVNGKWVEVEGLLGRFGWDDDFDPISEKKALQIMKELGE